MTGLSGSGKSSLAFDTIYAEGQRRYVESLSAYARQFLGQMDKPDVDSIEGLSPAISIDQKTTSRNPRSTVGTVTEIYDYLRLLWARIGHPHCHSCGAPIAGPVGGADRGPRDDAAPRAPASWCSRRSSAGARASTRTCSRRCAPRASRAPRSTASCAGSRTSIELDKKYKHDIAVVVDRLQMKPDVRKRLADSVETAVALAEGIVEVEMVDGAEAAKPHSSGAKGVRESAAHARLLGEVLLPELRHVDAGAGAADLLVQLTARRVSALHRPRLPDGDRPRPRGGPVAVGQRGRNSALELGGRLLRAARAGDRREVRHRPGRAVGGPARRRTRTCSCTAPRASGCTSPTATGWGGGGPTWLRSRAS